MHDSKPVRLLITLNGPRHRPVHEAHAPATRYADQEECTNLRLLLAVTRRRRSASGRPVGLQPLTQKGCPSATQSPSVCVDRQGQSAWQLARSIASLSLTAVLQSVVAT